MDQECLVMLIKNTLVILIKNTSDPDQEYLVMLIKNIVVILIKNIVLYDEEYIYFICTYFPTNLAYNYGFVNELLFDESSILILLY